MTKQKKASKLAFSGFVLGHLCGTAWFGALLPIGISGIFLYDLSRYGFSIGALIALLSLFSAEVRQRAVGRFFVGLTITALVLFVPAAGLLSQQMSFLFVIPMGLVLLSTMVILWLAGRGKSGNMRIEDTVSAPNRFGIGTVMVMVLAACVLLSFANGLGVSPVFTATVGIFLTVICGLQMLIQKVPRAISVGAGAVLFPMAIALSWNHYGLSSHPLLGQLVKNPSDIVFLGTHLLTVGAILGYGGGTLVAGLFLVLELLQRITRPKSQPA